MTLQIPANIVSQWPNVFDNAVDRLLAAPTEIEQNSLFLGFGAEDQAPITIDRRILPEHGLIIGGPGSNKTSVGLSPIVSQLIARADQSVVIIDLKGDMALFNNAREEAEWAGMPFRYFTTVAGNASHVFNPLEQTYLSRTSRAQRAQQLMAALGLDYGDIYGASFFSSIMELYLTNLMERYADNISSLTQLLRFCDPAAYKGLGPSDDWQKSRHLHAILKRLTEVYPLNAVQADFPAHDSPMKSSIQVAELLTRPTVVYFYMPAMIQAVTGRSIARLFLFSLLTAAALMTSSQKTLTVNVIIDEFQEMISGSTQTVLNQARGFKIPCLLSFQSLDQLKNGDLDLRDIILNGTLFKQVFRVQDLQMWDYLQRLGGEQVTHSLGWQQEPGWFEDYPSGEQLHPRNAAPASGSLRPRFNVQEVIRPAMEPNLIKQVSAHPHGSLIYVGKNSGLTHFHGRWVPTYSGYHVDYETYLRRATAMPWPQRTQATVVEPVVAAATGPRTAKASSPTVHDPLLNLIHQQAKANLAGKRDSTPRNGAH
jgi:hypothetical protein